MLTVDDIKKSFFGVPALRGVSLAVAAGSVLGLVGENGAGKSTLMNVLGGVLQPDGGKMTLAGEAYVPRTPADAARHGIAFVHQELNLFANLSIAENLFLSAFPCKRIAGLSFLDRAAMRERTAALLARVQLAADPATLVEQLSPGERQLVEIAKALSLDARLIILDEPTTSLTSRETEKLFALLAQLRAQGLALIYISHVLGDVLRLCDDIVVLRDGAVVGAGKRAEFTSARLISLMVGRDLTQLYPPRATTVANETALRVEALTQPGVIEDIYFTLRRGEVLGIAGLMGAGRTELARILFGLDPSERGKLYLNEQDIRHLSPRERIARGLAFLTENRREEGLLMEASIADNIALAALPMYARAGAAWLDQATLQRDIAALTTSVQLKSAPQQAARTLSGGNQQKVVLAKWLLRTPSVFILDEPTRGVDVGARYELYQLINQLAGKGAGVLFISSEIEELIGMCDRILVMKQGCLTASFARAEFEQEAILRAALEE